MVNTAKIYTIRDDESQKLSTYYKMDYITVMHYKVFRTLVNHSLGVKEFIKYAKAQLIPLNIRKVASVTDTVMMYKGKKVVYNNLTVLDCSIGFSIN